ncbi:MAG: transketolase [Desulfovibrio sp.]|nr:MAG: transketolase [Desulfovibrio sp.]
MIQKAGSGHIGSSFSCLDVTAWLHLREMRRDPTSSTFQDVYFSSKGHDAPAMYAILLGLGLLDFELIHTLRRIDGLPGHPDVGTPGIPTNTGALGMGIGKAKGMVLADRLQGRDRRILVMLGDGELQEGQIWESLAFAANREMREITAIVDANKIQSDIWTHLTSDMGDVEEKFRAFGWRASRINGHDTRALAQELAACRDEPSRPQVIIADTTKGQGVSLFQHQAGPDEAALYLFHSGALGPEVYASATKELLERVEVMYGEAGLTPPEPVSAAPDPAPIPMPGTPQSLIGAYSAALVEQGRANPDLVVLDADLKKDCGLIPFEEEFPERFIECGIAEQDMVSMAGGLALSGKTPLVHSFACFLTTRANEQIFNNASELSKIIYVGSLAGLLPAGPGHSHQGVRDIAAMAPMPGMTVAVPGCEAEVGPLLDALLHQVDGPGYLRLFTPPWPVPFSLPTGFQTIPGQGTIIHPGTDVALIAYGPVMLSQAFLAAQELDKQGVSTSVINLPWLNRIDADWLKQALGKAKLVVTLDDHSLTGGLRDLLAPALHLNHSHTEQRAPVMAMGLDSLPQCGRHEEVLARHKLDAGAIAQRVKQWIQAST